MSTWMVQLALPRLLQWPTVATTPVFRHKMGLWKCVAQGVVAADITLKVVGNSCDEA